MVEISQDIVHQIYYYGEKSYPDEGCGMILGTKRDGIHTVHEVIEMNNAQEVNRDVRYLITPEQYRLAEQLAKEKNMELLGFFHSHPDHEAVPSLFDREHALPCCLYMIVSIVFKHGRNITAWVLSENRLRFDEQPINII